MFPGLVSTLNSYYLITTSKVHHKATLTKTLKKGNPQTKLLSCNHMYIAICDAAVQFKTINLSEKYYICKKQISFKHLIQIQPHVRVV